MKRPNPQWEVDVFNAAVKVGDIIEYSEVIGVTDPVRYATKTAAQVLSGHTAVVWLVGKSGCVAVSHCKPITTERELTPEAQADRDAFERDYGGGNCSCHLSPPCGSCIHPGNPRNQEEDETCWQGAA